MQRELTSIRYGKWQTQVETTAAYILRGKKVLYVTNNVELECRFWIDVYSLIWKVQESEK